MTKQENTQNLIGRKFKGFEFENELIGYPKVLDKYIGDELEIIKFDSKGVYANNTFWYPLEEVLKHLIPEEEEIHIPELPEGVLMLVSDDNKIWKERKVIGNYKGVFIVESKGILNVFDYKYCKPLPKLPQYTMQQLFEKLGEEFEIIE